MNAPRVDARPQLVTMGETLVSLFNLEPGPLRHANHLDLSIGGAESNVAIGAARLGIPAAWVGRVGDDEFGQLVVNKLRAEGIDVHVHIDAGGPTALMFKSRRTSDLLAVEYYRRGSAGSRLSPADVDVELISSADVFHVSAIASALSDDARDAVRFAISVAKNAGTLVSVDLNYRSALWSPVDAAAEFQFLSGVADILFCTMAEAQIAVHGDDPLDLAQRLAGLGAGQVIVKQGAEGALSWRDGQCSIVKPLQVTAIDDVGAGDAFAAGFLASLIVGGTPDRNLAWAAAMGAWAVSTRGDWEGLPSLGELTESLSRSAATDAVAR